MFKGLPGRQRLVGVWLLLGGASLAGGAAFGVWLESQLTLTPLARLLMWLCALSGGAALLAAGYLLERHVLEPLRALHGEFAKLLANPDRPVIAPGGWLESLGPDIDQIAKRWRVDRERLESARREGACEATRIRRELEGLLQQLTTPILLFDPHRRLLLFNSAAEAFFPSPYRLGLGKELKSLIPDPALSARFDALMGASLDKTFSRQTLTQFNERTLLISLTRLSQNPDEALVTFKDVTRAWQNEVDVKKRMRAALARLSPSPQADKLRALWQHPDLISEQLSSIWSNAFWQALDEQLNPTHRLITPIGIPGWFKGHAPSLVALFDVLIKRLHGERPRCDFEGALVNADERVWLAFIWQGEAIDSEMLYRWRRESLDSLPLTPSVDDALQMHGSTLWSEKDPDGVHARLCVSVQGSKRRNAPNPHVTPRPEFHDFDLSNQAPPDTPLGEQALDRLTIVAFDTETTGLNLRGGDTLISLGACRIVHNRLLADDVFESYIDPRRSISPESTAIHGLRDQDVQGAPKASSVLEAFQTYTGEAVLLAHNASFDLLALSLAGAPPPNPVLDTLLISKALDKGLPGHDLDTLTKRYAITLPPGVRHTALGDAQLTAALWLCLLARLKARNIDTLSALLAFQAGALDKQDGHL